ncbi:glycosyltransferase [Pseudorhodoplanes sp.]|uniref:glycosyltransferase n=1 Tax=Pseudorhodoplanes sp. TaxID=1934341 RepID=UPI00391AFC5D
MLTNIVLALAGLTTVGGMAVIAHGLVFAPTLPTLSASTPEPHSGWSSAGTAARSALQFPAIGLNNRQVPDAAAKALRFAFFDHSDVGSTASLHQHAVHLDAIIPDWLEIERFHTGPGLTVERRSRTVVDWLRKNAAHVKIYPEVTTKLSASELAELLGTPAARTRIIERIAQYLNENDFSGVTLTLRNIPPSAHRNLVVFLVEIGKRIRSDKRELIFTLPESETEQHARALSRLSDYVLLKLHDDGGAEPAPIAPQGRVEARLNALAAGVDRTKIIVTIGSFGYDWDEWGGKRMISAQAAWDLASRADTKPSFDDRSLNPGFLYRDNNGTRHHVWYLDAITAFNQLKAILAIEPAGIAVWRLGLEDRGVWAFAGRGRLPDESALASIGRIEPGFDSFARARAAVLGVKPGHSGQRRISYNPHLGLVIGQLTETLPRQAILTEWHPRAPKTVSLTFDDGPDPVYTPQILDILARHSAKATFYVVGINALAYPELLKRIYDEGHDLGNHSWSHAEMHTGSSVARITSELNGTQRVFEGKLNIRSILFRPPYTAGDYKRLDDAVDLVRTASALGYVFAGFDGNAFDYFLGKEQIISETLAQVESGARVMLFHDSGGNRQRTIDALPAIIDQLKAKGFRFVTTHELIGKTRDEIMPRLSGEPVSDRVKSFLQVEFAGFLLWLATTIPAIAVVAAILGVTRLLLIVAAALIQLRRTSARPLPKLQAGKIAVVVPAYNEEAVICKTVSALLASTCSSQLEIIVIDDGSRDRTSDRVRQTFEGSPNVLVYRKDNGGKASALNVGIAKTDAEIIVAIDGDTVLWPDAIEHLVAHFQDPTIGAVAGNVIVGNQKNLMTRFQALEYVTSQNLDRRAFELVNAIGVVPGAIGAWRRSALIDVKGYSRDTLAEDADLTLSIERRGWRVVGESRARALTEAPETLRAFMKQRFRWMFGTLQVAWKHARLAGPGRGVTLVVIPNIFLFQFGFTLLAPFMDALLIVAAGAAILNHDQETSTLLIGYWLMFQTVDAAAATIGIALSGDRANWRLLPLIIVQRFCYRQLLYVVAIRALFAAIKGRLVGWGKLVRTGSVAWPNIKGMQGAAKP